MENNTIKFNVGGKVYKTSRSTIERYPDSMLAALISGKFELNEDKKGRVYVNTDRNGEMFGIVLDAMRNNKLILPKDFNNHDLLAAELDYYGLPFKIEYYGQADYTRKELFPLLRTEIRGVRLCNMDLSFIVFENRVYNVDFSGSTLYHCSFLGHMYRCVFRGCTIDPVVMNQAAEHSVFENCEFKDFTMDDSDRQRFMYNSFKNCNFGKSFAKQKEAIEKMDNCVLYN